jgi:1-phosphofructokinase family hexose kinase
MIVVVTLNSLLEKKYYCNNFTLNKTHRVDNIVYSVGGKGINISRQLNLLDIQNQSFLFIGGENGKIIRKKLIEEKINFVPTYTKAQTREACVIIDEVKKNITTVMESKYKIEANEIEEMKTKLEKAIQNCNILVLSGSLSSPNVFDIIKYGIEKAKENDKLTVLDSHGSHLRDAIELQPDILHNNLDEINSSLKLNLQSDEEILNFTDELYNKGIKISIITDGGKPAYVNHFGFKYKFYPPQIDEIHPTGSGDALVAGILYGITNSHPFTESLKFGMALGTLNAQKIEVCNITKSELENFNFENIKVETIGQKMNTIF